MNRSAIQSALAVLALLCISGGAAAQAPGVKQVLKDVWVATDQALLDFDVDAGTLSSVPGVFGVSATRSVAFEPPQVGGTGLTRSLLVVDGAKLVRFANDATVPFFDAGTGLPSLTTVNAVAVADDGIVLFSGYSKPKRVYEVWALDPATMAVQLRASGTPQLTDTVYVNAEDAAASTLPGAGVLAATGKSVMFFPEPAAGWMSTSSPLVSPPALFDTASVGLKGSAQFLSAALVRDTNVLLVTTSDRKLLVTTPSGAIPTATVTIPKPATCNIKTQRLLVRNASGGTGAISVVSDACSQIARYDSATATLSTTAFSSPLVALAVGEGNAVTCLASEPKCTLTDGFNAKLQTTVDKELFVLQYDNLCDPRVLGCAADATGSVDASNFLTLNTLLPQAVQDALDVDLKIPPYMFAAGPNGRFGLLIVQTDDAGTAAKTTVELDIEALLGFELGTRSTQKGDPFVRAAPDATTLNLLNQDIVAYAPDNASLPTVRGFEATPATTGSYNPLVGGLRGFSVVIYGLQHDLNAASRPRDGSVGGLPSLVGGSTPMCALSSNAQTYTPVDEPARFFVNLSACLYADQEQLLTGIVPAGALSSGDRAVLLARLTNVEDKLIKALTATGPNTGSTDFQSVISQLDLYDAAVAATPFYPLFNVYKNELAVRSAAFRFILVDRAYPSLPLGGFPQP